MRPSRIPAVRSAPSRAAVALAAAAALALALSGCAEKPNRLVGNERLLRGGLGVTDAIDTVLSRDTYASPRTAFDEGILLAGRTGAYEARALLHVRAWTLPDTADPTLAIDSLFFEMNFDSTIGLPPFPGVTLQLWMVDGPIDAANVAWPGPSPTTLLGELNPADVLADPFRITLSPALFPQVRTWALAPDSVHFVLLPSTGDQLAGFFAGSGRFRIVSHVGTAIPTSVSSPVTTDLTIHTPVAPPPTGADTALVLGGLARSEVLLRAPDLAAAEGASINGARIVLRLVAPAPPSGEKYAIQVARVRSAWSENVTSTAGLTLDAALVETLSDISFSSAADSLVVPVPAALMRAWVASPAANEGILLRVRESYLRAPIYLGSRESPEPPIFRMVTTTRPPGRF